MSNGLSYYDLLGLRRDATPEEIRAAYKKAQQANHPDRVGGDDEYANARSSLLNKAYTVLRDPKKRAEYDRELSQNSIRTEHVATAEQRAATHARTPYTAAGTPPNYGGTYAPPHGSGGDPRSGAPGAGVGDALGHDWSQERSVWGWVKFQYQVWYSFLRRRGRLFDVPKLAIVGAAVGLYVWFYDTGYNHALAGVWLGAVVAMVGVGIGLFQGIRKRPAQRRDALATLAMAANGIPMAVVGLAVLVVLALPGLFAVSVFLVLLVWSFMGGGGRSRRS